MKFKFSEPDGSTPVEFRWTLNSGELLGTVPAVDGKATVKLLASDSFNRLEVYSHGADHTFSPTTTVFFSATLHAGDAVPGSAPAGSPATSRSAGGG